MNDEELEELIRRRDAGDDEARDAIDAWVEQCLHRTVVIPSEEKEPSRRADSADHR